MTIAVCGALGSSGCGGGDASTGAAEADRTETAAAESPPTGLKGPKPKIEVPKNAPPKKLVVEELKRGTGKRAKTGDEVTIQFAGIYFNGEPVDSSWELGGPFEFVLGTTVASPGWETGIPGMKVGGRRKLIIPWNLTAGYIPPGTPKRAQVYVIDLLEVG